MFLSAIISKRRPHKMKKMARVLIYLSVIMCLGSVSIVSAETKDENENTKEYTSLGIPEPMGPGTVIQYVSDTEFVVLEGDVIPESLIIRESDRTEDVTLYPSPTKGTIVYYSSEGYIMDIFDPNEVEGESKSSLGFTTFENVITPYASYPPIDSSGNSNQCQGNYVQIVRWGTQPNILYKCRLSSYANSIYKYKGTGIATTFSDRIGQENRVLSKGSIATKLAYDNIPVGSKVLIIAKTKSGSYKQVEMTKEDAGGMPNAIVDIWKTGVEHWGYTWNSTFSIPGQVTIYHREDPIK